MAITIRDVKPETDFAQLVHSARQRRRRFDFCPKRHFVINHQNDDLLDKLKYMPQSGVYRLVKQI
jgi:hypothetical protein